MTLLFSVEVSILSKKEAILRITMDRKLKSIGKSDKMIRSSLFVG
jgi:hypothetical protein